MTTVKSFLKFILGSRLHQKFVLLFIILAAVPVLILGGMSLYLIDLSHQYDVSALELQLIDQKIEEVRKFFIDVSGVLEFHLGGGGEEAQKIFEAKITDEELAFLVEGPLKSNRAFEEVTLYNRQGKEIIRRNREGYGTEPEDISNLVYFREVVDSGKTFFSGVRFALSGPMMTVTAPIKNPDGAIVRVVSAEVNLSSLTRSFEGALLGSAGYLILLDRNGALMAEGGRNDVKLGLNFSDFERVERLISGGFLDGLDRKDRYESLLDGVPVAGSGKKIPETGWLILAEWPLEDANAVIHEMRRQIFTITIFSIFAVLLLAPLFALRLIRPIEILEKGAEDIERGNFDKKVDIKTGDELEELGVAFNNMARGLKRLQELKSEFVFIAAHELRTPVTAIKGYLSMVFEGSAGVLSESMRKYLEPVLQANDRLIQLVNDILEIARSEAGRMKVEVAPMELGDAVRSILTEIKPLADEKKIAVSYDILENMPKVLGDPARVKEVVMNFVSNAIKYNNTGGQIKIYHEIRENMAVTNVEDHGLGMSEDDKKHIFEKFFRSDEGKIKAIQGTGLGLFITKELVEKMNGQVWFKSELGKGSTFSFSLLKV